MKRIKHISISILATLALLISLGGCSNHDYYDGYEYIQGRWYLYSINGYPVYSNSLNYSEFVFDYYGKGSYSSYNNAGQWSSMPITYETYVGSGGRDFLNIYPYYGGTWQYRIALTSNSFTLVDLETSDILVYYAAGYLPY